MVAVAWRLEELVLTKRLMISVYRLGNFEMG